MTLLAPLRARVETLSEEARASLAALPDDHQCSMGYDAATTALDELAGCGAVARDVRREISQAIQGRNGFDTWPRQELARTIDLLKAIADKFEKLSAALRELRTAEAIEIERLRAERDSSASVP